MLVSYSHSDVSKTNSVKIFTQKYQFNQSTKNQHKIKNRLTVLILITKNTKPFPNQPGFIGFQLS